MKYFQHINGLVYAFRLDGSQDHLITVDMRAMTESEVYAHLNPPPSPEALAALEDVWVETEKSFIANNLLYIEDENPEATSPLVPKSWRNYRIQVMAWQEGNPDFPDMSKRPLRPS